MGLFGSSTEFESLEDLYKHQLQDLYDAEHRLIDNLPKMAEKATDPQLRLAFEKHLEETRGQVTRLEQVMKACNVEQERETCEAMKGLLREASDTLEADAPADVKDAALIASAQRIEHYEIAGYGTACSLANRLGRTECAQTLHATLEEEKATDEKLSTIARAVETSAV